MPVNLMEKCTGCYACANICPKNCIEMCPDQEGFVQPCIDTTLCISCNLCEKVCPVLHSVDIANQNSNPTVYAAWSLDEETRILSTSGGVYTELAMDAVKNGSYLCGARYDQQHRIEHVIVKTQEGIRQLRQSKYAQSDIGYSFRRIRELLDSGERLLFCGAPCQCSGLLNMINKPYDNLTVIDFICRGANSPKVYQMFLKNLESQYQSSISQVWFKNKTYGWNRFSTKIEFEDGQSYLKDRNHDLYIQGYIKHNLFMRPCCHDCHFKKLPRNSDLTLGDFWGIQLDDPSLNTDLGTSLILVNTSKGDSIFLSICDKLFYAEKSLEHAIERNPCILNSAPKGEKRDYFFQNIDRMPLDKLLVQCYKEPWTLNRIYRSLQSRIHPFD